MSCFRKDWYGAMYRNGELLMSEKDFATTTRGFQCPHCQGHIRFTVEAYEPEISIEFDDDEPDYGYENDADLPSEDYFRTMEDMSESIRTHRYKDAVRFAQDNFKHLVRFAEDRNSVNLHLPIMTHGIKVLAVMGERELLTQMLQTVNSTPSLSNYAYDVERCVEDADMHDAIVQAVTDNPDCLQPDVKIHIDQADGRRVANLITYLENAGRITRTRNGRKILLNIP